jgi:hypothetical protein
MTDSLELSGDFRTELVEPVQHHLDSGPGWPGWELEHQEPLAIGGDIIASRPGPSRSRSIVYRSARAAVRLSKESDIGWKIRPHHGG